MDRHLRKEIRIKELYASISEWLTMILIGSIQLHFVYLAYQHNSLNNKLIANTFISIAFFLVVGYYFTHKKSLTKIRIRLQYNTNIKFIALNDFFLILSTICGSFAIHVSKQWIELPPIIIATAITIFATLLLSFTEKEILKSCDFAFYAGIFTGLTANFNGSFFFLFTASVLTGVLYILSKNLLVGVGGRLGSFTFVAIWLTTFVL